MRVGREMERYYFDIGNGHLTVDTEGRELAGADAITEAAMSTLLEVARFEVVANNERELSVSDPDPSKWSALSASFRASWS